jgi:DNA polymerase-3 subunit delta'
MTDDEDFEPIEAPFTLPPLLPWQSGRLRKWLEHKAHWHHATLLSGQAGLGSRRLALHLARGLMCQTRAITACGECTACRLFAAGTHPDFRLVERAYDEKSRAAEPRRRDAIVVDQIRGLIDGFVYLSAHLSVNKVAVIYLAEDMNPPAANALLKSLEEPPPATCFILVSHQRERLPPTIISRCMQLSSPGPTPAEAAEWLRQQGAADPASVLAQAAGAPLHALAMVAGDYQDERKRFLARLADPRRLSVVAMGAEADSGPRTVRRQRLQQWFDLLATWSYDLASASLGLSPRYHPDFERELDQLAKAVAPKRILRYHRSLLAERALLTHPLNPRLVAENALHGYRAALLGE